jgi:hypothetical protein
MFFCCRGVIHADGYGEESEFRHHQLPARFFPHYFFSSWFHDLSTLRLSRRQDSYRAFLRRWETKEPFLHLEIINPSFFNREIAPAAIPLVTFKLRAMPS